MNKEQIKKSLGHHVRLRPVPKRLDGSKQLPATDDDWLISRTEATQAELRNVKTGHIAILGLDHIHSFMSDPGRDRDGVKYGFLQLRVQLSLEGQLVRTEPLPPGDWGKERESADQNTQSQLSAHETLALGKKLPDGRTHTAVFDRFQVWCKNNWIIVALVVGFGLIVGLAGGITTVRKAIDSPTPIPAQTTSPNAAPPLIQPSFGAGTPTRTERTSQTEPKPLSPLVKEKFYSALIPFNDGCYAAHCRRRLASDWFRVELQRGRTR